jgi:hypothetical protein
MRNWLHSHSFSYKKPAVVPGKANQEQMSCYLCIRPGSGHRSFVYRLSLEKGLRHRCVFSVDPTINCGNSDFKS